MKHTLIAVLISICFSSCYSYMEIFHTSPTNKATVINKQGYPVFENDTIRVVYEFWDLAGRMSFIITNKYSKPIYIDWKKCSYIRDGEKKDYYEESVTTKSVSVTNGQHGSIDVDWYTVFGKVPGKYGESRYATASTGKSVKNERVVFIPPGSSISLRSNYYISNAIAKVDDWSVVKKDLKEKKEHVIRLSKEESKVQFRNFITYSTTENFTTEQYLDNGFYLSSVSLIPYVGSGASYSALNDALYEPRSYYHISIKKYDIIRDEKPNQRERL